MGGVRVKLLADFLKGGHPGDSKMAVLEDNPCAVFLSLFDHPEGDGTLALPEGERAQLSTAKALWKKICVHVCIDLQPSQDGLSTSFSLAFTTGPNACSIIT